MSFALEYRRRMQATARKARAERTVLEKTNAGFVVMPAAPGDDTRGNRRRVLAALSLAALILSVFNSESLVRYAGSLGDIGLGARLVVATERWHRLMQQGRMTVVVKEIRHAVSEARAVSWPDWTLAPTREATRPGESIPARTRPAPSYLPRDEQPTEARLPAERRPPSSPMMRAAVAR